MDAHLGQVALEPTGNRTTSSLTWVSLLSKQPPRATSRRAEHKQEPAPKLPGHAGGLMSREEELALFYRWKNGGDDRALHKLVLAYEPLVTSMAYDLHRRGFSVED